MRKSIKSLSKRETTEIEHFNKMSSLYDKNYGYDRPFTKYKIKKKAAEFVDIIKQVYGDKKITVVELGAGTGEYTQHLAKLLPHAKIIAVDISKDILSEAKRKCKSFKNVQYLVESAYNTHLNKESADVVCGFYALHHFDIQETYKESYRILRKGGLVFFYEPNILNPLVYLIKSSKYLKSKVGDSPDEWAINPLTISKSFPKFDVKKIYTSEFIWPLGIIPFKYLFLLDRITAVFKYLPITNIFGGSLALCLRKK